MSLDITALSDFNNETAAVYLEKAVNGGSTMEYITVKEGIKYKEPIGQLEVELFIQNTDCPDASGSLVLSDRDITVTPRVSFDGICLDKLNKKALGVGALEAGSYNETFGLVDQYASQIVKQFQKSNDYFLWNATDGLRGLISGSTAGVITATGSGSTAPASGVMIDVVNSIVEQIPDEVNDREDLVVFMSIANLNKYKIELTNSNNFHYNTSEEVKKGGGVSITHPTFSNINIVGTIGLSGSNRIVAGPAKQIVAGTDLLTDLEQFQIFYDLKDDKLYHRVKTKLGVQIAYPEFWVTNDRA